MMLPFWTFTGFARLRAAARHLFHGLQPHGQRDLLPQAPTFGVIHLAAVRKGGANDGGEAPK